MLPTVKRKWQHEELWNMLLLWASLSEHCDKAEGGERKRKSEMVNKAQEWIRENGWNLQLKETVFIVIFNCNIGIALMCMIVSKHCLCGFQCHLGPMTSTHDINASECFAVQGTNKLILPEASICLALTAEYQIMNRSNIFSMLALRVHLNTLLWGRAMKIC